ncbi:MAG TPA: thiolase family protein [Planctomycetota bacterium]|jgi:acetyl-CoA acetyltransferase|nr:thiolase family protein [Planctomycetota bacterium]
MALENTFIPHGAYWTTPFCRWQGSLAREHSLELAGRVGRSFLEGRGIAADAFDALHLGHTVYQRQSFYGAPWVAALLGAPTITGPSVAQACATSARLLAGAALEVESGLTTCALTVACDRTSNGPHVYFPDPAAPGGTGTGEDPVIGNFSRDPHAGLAMIETAENVAREAGIERAEQEEIALLRHEQYAEALADDRAFQRRYMQPVELRRGRKVTGVVDADEGIHPTTRAGLEGLRPVMAGGTITFGTQTHPADGNAGMVVTTRERAREWARDPAVSIRILGWGEARVAKGMMPKATVPAARAALERSGLRIEDCTAIKTHNPFAVADAFFCREMGVPAESVNRYGSPLIWGHPQAPMGLRVVIELVEELVERGGGAGLFAGCAGGDTAMALCVRVG